MAFGGDQGAATHQYAQTGGDIDEEDPSRAECPCQYTAEQETDDDSNSEHRTVERAGSVSCFRSEKVVAISASTFGAMSAAPSP